MNVFSSFDEARGIKNPVVTTGSFDGVHVGHRTIINRLRMLASKYEGESVLITFYPHPRKVLYPDTLGKSLKLLNTQREKRVLLEKAGVDNIIVVNFTLEFSKITSEQFVRLFLFEKLSARVVVAGFNHHFGFNKEGDYRQLWSMRDKYGFEAEEIPEQEVEHETVSSTRIRKAISEGFIQRANAYLDHYYLIMGYAYKKAFFTGNVSFDFDNISIEEDTKLLPSAGVYAVTVQSGGFSGKGMALIIPDVEEKETVLVHTLGDHPDLTGKDVTLLFQKKVTGPVIPGSGNNSGERLRSAYDEISELIY